VTEAHKPATTGGLSFELKEEASKQSELVSPLKRYEFVSPGLDGGAAGVRGWGAVTRGCSVWGRRYPLQNVTPFFIRFFLPQYLYLAPEHGSGIVCLKFQAINDGFSDGFCYYF